MAHREFTYDVKEVFTVCGERISGVRIVLEDGALPVARMVVQRYKFAEDGRKIPGSDYETVLSMSDALIDALHAEIFSAPRDDGSTKTGTVAAVA